MPDGNKLHGVDMKRFANMVPDGAQWLNPLTLNPTFRNGCPKIDGQRFIRFGTQPDRIEYHLLIHARNRQFERTANRNWPKEKWLELVSQLPSEWSVGWIGTRDEAMAFGSNDLRSQPLNVLLNEIRKSALVIGPSSGPMHLASLCGIPHVVWSGNARDVPRYADVWNPFQVPHSMIRTWQPEVPQVIEGLKKYLPLP